MYVNKVEDIYDVKAVKWNKEVPWCKCKNYGWIQLSKRLLTTLALIIVRSIYIGQLDHASAAWTTC